MKELTEKEKAKAYDEAIERAKGVIEQNPLMEYLKKGIEYIFPELRESEDERIRSAIIDHLKDNNLTEWAAWLEKQCEQKPADKVEPKFREGEWLCENEPNNYARFIQILETVNVQGKDRYRISRDIHKDEDVVEFGFVEKYYHKFDIKDAKAGDVLACPNDAGDRDVVFIFKSINSDEGWVFCFCASDANGCFCTNNDYVGNSNSTNISPATKEQRDLLFQKMKEAGYEWNPDTKKLKKIEQKPDEDRYMEGYLNGINDALKTLKTAAWSEEDEKQLNDIIRLLPGLDIRHNWLKSLKDRYAWKPSDEQIKALEHFVRSVGESGYASPYDNNTKLIYSLLEQLKKL